MRIDRETIAAIDEVDRSVDTSGHICVQNALRHAKEMEKLRAECHAAGSNYERIIDTSGDLLQIRRHKAAFENSCERKK